MSDPEEYMKKVGEDYSAALKKAWKKYETAEAREYRRHNKALERIKARRIDEENLARESRDSAEAHWWENVLTEEQREVYRAQWKAEREARKELKK